MRGKLHDWTGERPIRYLGIRFPDPGLLDEEERDPRAMAAKPKGRRVTAIRSRVPGDHPSRPGDDPPPGAA